MNKRQITSAEALRLIMWAAERVDDTLMKTGKYPRYFIIPRKAVEDLTGLSDGKLTLLSVVSLNGVPVFYE